MIRNLIESAHLHGAPVEVDVRVEGTLETVIVSDHGAGVPEGDRERVLTGRSPRRLLALGDP